MATGSLSDEDVQEHRKTRQADVLRQREEDFRLVMSSPGGRRFLWRLIDEDTRTHGASFAGESTHLSAYQEGIRAVGISFRNEAQDVDSSAYILMMKEQLAERQRLAAEVPEETSRES